MNGKQSSEQSQLRKNLDNMRFLNAGSDASMYLYDIAEGNVYFTDSFDKKYHLPPMTEGYYTLSQMLEWLHWRENSAMVPGLRDIPEKLRPLCYEEYWLILEQGAQILLKNEIRVEYADSGEPRWIIGRLSDAATNRNVDALTGLRNGEKLMEDLHHWEADTMGVYLMILGIDNFRDINTRHGWNYGTEILKKAGEILESETRKADRIYRLESDRFAILAPGVQRNDLEKLYERIRFRCTPAFTMSAGAAEYHAGGTTTINEFYLQVENTLDQAKRQGKNMLLFYSADLLARYADILELQDELRQSVADNFKGFALTYQPQVICGSFELFGAEALLRYRSPKRGMVYPDVFIPILERTGLIIPVGEWVLKTALEQCRSWRTWRPDMHISVNVSCVQLRESGVADRLLDIVEKSGVPGSAVTLEVTESMQLQDFRRYNKIFYQLARSGIKIAIDDFGTGYSSLSYLKNIVVHEIKIDRSFISRLQHSSYNYQLLCNMIDLARSAHLRICCEGVETEEELAVLRELGQNLLQGYLFAKPWDPEQFQARYINPESSEYTQYLQQAVYFRSMPGRTQTEKPVTTVQDTPSAIVECMEELVYVCEQDSYELLYMNAAGREMTGAYDYKGCKCYQILANRNQPCEGCTGRIPSSETYHVRERWNAYLNRHFLLKEKQLAWQGRDARLCVAVDVTEKEITSWRIQNKLDFEKNIVDCTQMLMNETNLQVAVSKLLHAVGSFYQADRAYVFALQDNRQFWDNTYEWCNEGIPAQIEDFKNVPISVTKRWMEQFQTGESIMIEDVDQLKEISPEEWKLIALHDVKSLIVSPIWRSRQLIGFIGVDNPKAHGMDSTQVQTISCFLSDRLEKEASRSRLEELLNLHYTDILKTTNMGLWVIRLSQDGSHAQMFMDQSMRGILGLREELSPEEGYRYWHDRINGGYFQYVSHAVGQMIQSGKNVELSYTWNHPVKGAVRVRCVGNRVADVDGMICLEGYHRELDDMDAPSFLADTKPALFEYNETEHSIYFHNGCHLLDLKQDRAENFPECWITSGIVHPHFVQMFRSLFADIRSQSDVKWQELLLKSSDGSYEWFRLSTHHLGEGELDENAMIVTLTPAGQERAMELEFLRQKEFYHAMLSEKLAYAELNLRSRRCLSLEGMWSEYAAREECEMLPYETILLRYGNLLIHPDDQEAYRSFLSGETFSQLRKAGGTTKKLRLRHLIDGQMRWVELTGCVFRDPLTDNEFGLLYMQDAEEKNVPDTIF